MGSELPCTATFNRRRADGKALLETNEIIFRSDAYRLKIPLTAITKLDARNGALAITWPEGTASLDLGPKAERWADKIRNPKSVLDKLGLKPEHRVSVLDVADADFAAQLEQRVARVSMSKPMKGSDAIFLGAETIDALDRIPKLIPYLDRAGAIWTITPKGKGGIKDTDILARIRPFGLVDVKVVAFSATHSANKFVIPKAQR